MQQCVHQQSASLRSSSLGGQRLTLRRPAPQRLAAAPAFVATAEAQKVRIKLKSYHTELITESVTSIIDAATSTGASIAGPVPLPTRRRIYTVLRSPNNNKDSREQFEIRTHSRLIDIKNLSPSTIDKLMNLDLPAGVDVEVKL